MIPVITFVVVFLHSVKHVNSSEPICPESFNCTDFGPFRFPFYNTTNTQCGLIKVDCTSGHEKIRFAGQSYEITSKDFRGSSVNIQNNTFQKLIETKSCEALVNNYSFPAHQDLFISITPLMTLFKCPNDGAKFDDYFDELNYNSYNICGSQYFYHKHPISPALLPHDVPHGCKVIQLPGRVNISHNNTDIFSLLTYEFSISFWSHRCEECYKRGGHCRQNHEKFQCLDAKKEKQDETLVLILVLTGSASVFILVLFATIFIISRRYKNNFFSYYLSKDKSQNVEDGSLFFGVSVFSYAELEDATKNFDPSCELGDGGFGAVYYGKLQDGREVAVKRLYEHNYKRVQHFMNEVEILTKLRHPHLVLLYGCTSRQSRELLLVYEYIPNGTVADHLHGEHANPGLLTWPIRVKIAVETANALVFLHASGIIHRDVKTNNILLDHNFSVKVADFGLSRLFPNNVTHVSTAPQGTPGYLDPQYHQRYQLTDKSDVYSFGVVLIELISSMAAVDLSRSQDEISLANLALNRIQRCAVDQLIDPLLGFDLNPEIKNMITSVTELAFRCLQFDSEMRPTMNEVLDVLMAIQGERRDTDDNISNLETVNLQPLSEINDSYVLLKNFPPSPICVASVWQSDSRESTMLSTNGDKLSFKHSH